MPCTIRSNKSIWQVPFRRGKKAAVGRAIGAAGPEPVCGVSGGVASRTTRLAAGPVGPVRRPAGLRSPGRPALWRCSPTGPAGRCKTAAVAAERRRGVALRRPSQLRRSRPPLRAIDRLPSRRRRWQPSGAGAQQKNRQRRPADRRAAPPRHRPAAAAEEFPRTSAAREGGGGGEGRSGSGSSGGGASIPRRAAPRSSGRHRRTRRRPRIDAVSIATLMIPGQSRSHLAAPAATSADVAR